MFDWFFNWLDPKIIKLEQWIHRQVVKPKMLDLDLDKVKVGEVRQNNVYRPPMTDEHFGPFVVNLQKAELLDYMVGPEDSEAFGLFKQGEEYWWRHRDAGITEDFRYGAFSSLRSFFAFCHDEEKYWDCTLRTLALDEELNDD